MNLFLFTANFPFGKSESFVANEINILSKKFDNIFIFPSISGGEKRSLPDNVEVVVLKGGYDRSFVLKSDYRLLLSVLIQEIARKPLFKNRIKENFSYLSRLIFKSYQLNDWISKNQNQNNIYYSYWFDDWATILSVLKQKKYINNFISRAHGFDLYDYRSKSGKIKFRKFQLKNIEKVHSVSIDGSTFLKNSFPSFSKKIKVSYLGTKDFGEALYKPSKTLKILTISNLYPLKRIHLLVEALRSVEISVEWKHFGKGDLFDEINKMTGSFPDHISCEFMGQKSNDFLMYYIKNHHFDVFVNLSKYEGLPVSIIEAISFGIPVFATDAGGTREIVNSNTGKLFDNNFNIKYLSESLNNFFISEYSQESFRNSARKFWLDNFNANHNYKYFLD